MSTMDIEGLVRAVRADLEARLPAALATVQARHAVDPITLAVPASWGYSTENMLKLAFAKYPRIVTMGASWDGRARDASGRYVEGQHTFEVNYAVCLRNQTDENLDLAMFYAWRYGEAIMECIATGAQRYNGVGLTMALPNQIATVEVIPHTIEQKDIYWLGGGQLTYSLEGRYLC